jgi:hypothetical protein
VALAVVLIATPVALVHFRGLRVVSHSPSTNIVLPVSGVVTAWSPISEHPLRAKEIEAAERINEGVVSDSPSTNIVLPVSGVVTSWSPVSEHPLRSKEIEAAERINEEQMRHRRQRWERYLRSREQGK